MINKNVKKLIFFITVSVLLVSIASATEINNHTISDTTNTITTTENNADQLTTDTISKINNNEQKTDPQQTEKKINKTKTYLNTKTAGTKKVYVKTSSQLINELTETDTTSTSKTINLKKGTYNINTNILLKNQKYTKIIINGNNSNIHGTYNTQFLNITSKYDVTINKLNIRYFKNANKINPNIKNNIKTNNSGAIANYGKLTVKNCTFQNNKYNYTEVGLTKYYISELNEDYVAGSGAIYNIGTLNIEKTNFNNNRGFNAGAIYNKGTITIKKSKFNNNYAFMAGAIYNEGIIKINNSNFGNNKADSYGYAGTIRNEKTLTINNSLFQKNHGSVGVISNTGTLTVKNSIFDGNDGYTSTILTYSKMYIDAVFKNNKGEYSTIDNYDTNTVIKGSFINNYNKKFGVIFNYADGVKINGNFINNTNKLGSGGALTNIGGYVQIQGTFKNNKAKQGGAISTYSDMNIQKSKFINNQAVKEGGAIYITSGEFIPEIIKIYANFTNNNATRGGAIFIEKNCKNIRINSNFTKNHAKSFGGAIYNSASNSVIVGTFNYNYANNKYNFICNKGSNCKLTSTILKYKFSKYGGAIYNKGNKTTIFIKSSQKATVEKLKTKITINKISTTKKGNTITINGKFTDETGNLLKNSKLKLNINGKIITTKTDKNGKYSYKYKTTKIGSNKIIVSYNGNANYIKTSAQKTFTVHNNNIVTIYINDEDSYWANKIINGDPFVAYYSTVYAQDDPGVYACIETRGLSYSPVNRIVKSKFYFKNYLGDIISRTVTPKYKTISKTSLISGYTPYKVDITYRKMTEQERYDFWYNNNY